MAELTKDEVTRRCQELVYKVSYTFYDSPYIILLRILVIHNVITEKRLSEILNVGPNDVRKYLGMLHVHRLVRRYVNKEKGTGTAWQSRGQSGPPQHKTRDVIYWYLDYREFSDVVKYRIAMMRRAIDEKIKNEVGKRGYICPNCARLYDPLEIAHTFDPASNAFLCEVCSTELIEDDPSLHEENGGGGGGGGGTGQDRMQRFNLATAPIRDALKSIEGARLPTINIVAWIAQNVVSVDADAANAAASTADGRKLDVVMGDVESDTAAAAKLAADQRAQNALPVWYTKSTITGQKTALGIKDDAARAREAAALAGVGGERKGEDEDDALAAHYANMAEGVEEDDEDEMEEPDADVEHDVGDGGGEQTPLVGITPAESPAATGPAVMVMVRGVAKPLAEVTEADEENMTPDEYEAYAAAV